MFIIFLFVFIFAPRAHQQIFYPVNYCGLAASCVHDGRGVCGSSPEGCSRRLFLDQCDMFEFNCDYDTHYQETYPVYCQNLPTSQTSTNPTTKDTTTETNCGVTPHTHKTILTSTGCPVTQHTSISTTTLKTTDITTTDGETSGESYISTFFTNDITISTNSETITSIDTLETTNESVIDFTDISYETNTETKTSTNTTKTTNESVNDFTNISNKAITTTESYNENTIEIRTDMMTLVSSTTNQLTTTHFIAKTISESTSGSATSIKTSHTTQPTIKITNVITSPTTSETVHHFTVDITTTSNDKTSTFHDNSKNTDDDWLYNNSTESSNETYQDESNIYVSKEKDKQKLTKHPKIITLVKRTTDPSGPCCARPKTWMTTNKHPKSNTDPKIEMKFSIDENLKKHIGSRDKLYKKRHSTGFSWWYPSYCGSKNCQRPIRWTVTTKTLRRNKKHRFRKHN